MKTIHELMEQYIKLFAEARDIMAERHKRYGYDNIIEGGAMGIPIRMADKLARIRNILARPELAEGDRDTLRDTFLDMANYSIIGIMLIEGIWEALAEKEVRWHTEAPNTSEAMVKPMGAEEEGRVMAKDHHQLREVMGRVQKDINAWSDHNFGDQPAIHPMMGLFEEMGELAHAWLKDQQGIRTNEDHEANMKDALGDWMVFAMDFCSRRGWKLGDIFVDTWEQVRKRDWKKNKEDGSA